MDGDAGLREFCDNGLNRRENLMREATPVRVAENQSDRPCALRRLQRSHRIRRVLLVPVEELFRVEEYLASPRGEESDRLFDHPQVHLRRHPQDVRHMEHRRFPENRDIFGLGLKQFLQLLVLFNRNASAAGRSERDNLRVDEMFPLGQFEEPAVAGGGPREATLDEINPELIQQMGKTYPAALREIDSRPLHTVA